MAPEAPRLAAAGERVATSVDRAAALRDRSASLARQVAGRTEARPDGGRERLYAAHVVAARFYRVALASEAGSGAVGYLAHRGVPADGPWVVGYAPDRPAGLVNELRRNGFTDAEIRASGLAATGRGGTLVDRFRDRVVVGIRDQRRPDTPVVAWSGYAPPGAAADVDEYVTSPATWIYEPGEVLFGVAEQSERTGGPATVAVDPLQAIALSAASVDDAVPPLVVAPAGPTLTPGQVAALTAVIDTGAGVDFRLGSGESGRRAAERAHHLLHPAVACHPTRPGRVWAVRGGTSERRPLVEVIVAAKARWAAARIRTADGRASAARTALAMLVGQPAQVVNRLTSYVARVLDLPVPSAPEPEPAPATTPPAPAPEVLAGAATPHGPPQQRDDPDTTSTPPEDLPPPPPPQAPRQAAASPAQQSLFDVDAGPDETAETSYLPEILGPAVHTDGVVTTFVIEPGQPHRDEQSGPTQQEIDDEPVRSAGPQPLGEDRPGPAGGTREPGGVLRRTGQGSSGGDRAPGPGTGRTEPGRGGLHGQAAPAELGADDGPRPGNEDDGPGAAASDVDGVDDSAESPPPFDGGGLVASTVNFRPTGQADLAPTGVNARIDANLAAIRTLQAQQAEQRPATPDDQRVYARWSGWGATPQLFDDRPQHREQYAAQRAELVALIGEDGFRAARRTTLNAHYTDAALVQPIWLALAGLGFTGELGRRRMLEPGCGSGNFIGFAPPGVRPVGVELDPMTAAIATALYPSAEIRSESFADTRMPDGTVDLVIGNVPFGNYRLADPVDNPGRRQPIHNHFILKALRATRVGGLVALITSRYTLDGSDEVHQDARERMAAMADLVGAIRLPTDAHAAAAGTEVVTDLLILRRRTEDPPEQTPDWVRVRQIELPFQDHTETFHINEHFAANPGMVCGQTVAVSGRHGPVLAVTGDGPAAAALTARLDQVVDSAVAARLTMTDPAPGRDEVVFHGPLDTPTEGMFVDKGDGTFTQVIDGIVRSHAPAKTQVAELRALIGLRTTVLELLDEEAANAADTPRMQHLREELNRRYDAYVAANGRINRFKIAEGTRTDPETGEVTITERRNYPRLGGFRDDPYWPYVAALEKFDDETQEASKADIFDGRVVEPATPVDQVDSPEDAVVVCWDTHNEIRLPEIARLLGLDSTDQARQAIDSLVFEEPGTGALIRRADYLSGNVRRKLRDAEQAAEQDPRFQANVTALRPVIPRDRTPAEIGARLGSPWVPAGDVQQWVREILEDTGVTVTSLGARWAVKGGSRTGVLARTVYGTEARCAQDLITNMLNSQTVEVTMTVGKGDSKRTVKDPEGTALAQAKAMQLDQHFRSWLWEDPDRAERLSAAYNDKFNARVPRSFAGDRATAPGMSSAYELHPHQHAAIARIRNSAGVGLYHGTGAGKTLEMIVGGMELRRLGLVNKPCYVVPKAVLGHFQREFLHAYPRARLLAADTEDLRGEKRRRFVARCSTGTWDAIIISHDAFKVIPVSREVRVAYLNRQQERLQAHLNNAEGADRHTVKDIEKQVADLEERIKAELESPSDPGVEFERTGIDMLFVDEAHVYKNLRVISAIQELSHHGNQITGDLDMKLQYLRRTGAKRVVVMATATPWDNSPAEVLTAMKYIAPELLEDMGIQEDDQFLATFVQARRRVEMTADGSRFQSRTRYARFVNIQDLKQATYVFADVVLKQHLNLDEPTIVGGRQEILSVPSSPDLAMYLNTLAGRARGVTSGKPDLKVNAKGELRKDNILWISNDGRMASLDLRLVGRSTSDPQKIDVVADRMAQLWHAHKDDRYFLDDGTEEPRRGSLILGFCDLGVPKAAWNVYDALRDELVARDVPADMIRFAQHAKNRRDREQLQRDAREGKIGILLGSRQGLGTGVNVQRRVIAVVQIDPTWKLTPLTQSLGRGQRQGNANPAIHHILTVTEKSYDPFFWQKVDDKARWTNQLLDPTDTTTNVIELDEDSDNGQINPAVMFAVGAGRPELLQLQALEQVVAELSQEQRIWYDEQFTLKASIAQNQYRADDIADRITQADAVLPKMVDVSGDAFAMTVSGARYDKRTDAGQALIDTLKQAANWTAQQATLGEIGNIPLTGTLSRPTIGAAYVTLTLTAVPAGFITIDMPDLKDETPVGLIRRLENRLAAVATDRAKEVERLDRIRANIDRARNRIGLPYPQEQALQDSVQRLEQLQKELTSEDSTAAQGQEDHPAADEPTAQGQEDHPDADEPTAVTEHGGTPAANDVDTDVDTEPATSDEPDPADTDTTPTAVPVDVAQVPAVALPAVLQPFVDGVDQVRATALSNADLLQIVRVNVPDNARLAVEPRIEDHMADLYDDPDSAAVAKAFFATDAGFRTALVDRIMADLTHAVHGTPPAAITTEEPATPMAVPPAAPPSNTPAIPPAEMLATPPPDEPALRASDETPPVDAGPPPDQDGTDAPAPLDPAIAATIRLLTDVGPSVTSEFDGGTPYTSRNRIRGPLRSVKTACNQLLRVRQWRPGTSPLNTLIDDFKRVSIDDTAPEELLRQSVLLAREARALRDQRWHPGVDPSLAMLNELARISSGFAADLVATALKRGRWERVFGRLGPNLHANPDTYAQMAAAAAASQLAAGPASPVVADQLPFDAGPDRAGQDLATTTSDLAGPAADEPVADVETAAQGAPATHTHYASFAEHDRAAGCADQLGRELSQQPAATMLDPHTELGWVLTVAHPHPGSDELLQDIRYEVEQIVERHGGAYDWSDGAELPPNDEALVDYTLAEVQHRARQAEQPQPATVTQPDDPELEPDDVDSGDDDSTASAAEPVDPAAEFETPAPTGHWTDQIVVEEAGNTVTVTGTTGAPREQGLRDLLKQHRFRFTDGTWTFRGRRRSTVLGDLDDWRTKELAATAPKPAGGGHRPTEQQQKVVDAYLAGQDIAVAALAGTGKTSTLVMLAAARTDKRIAYVAFNRSIADEAREKFGRNVTAKTSHGFARAGLQNTPLRTKVGTAGPWHPGARFPEQWARILGIEDVDEFPADSLAHAVKATLRAFRQSDHDTVGRQHLPARFREPGAEAVATAVIGHARAAWADINDPDGKLHFDHDDYLKIWALTRPRLPYDVIFFDEAQDINPVLARVIQDQPVQTIVVGDSNQSIYGFRGAVDALSRWPADVELPLTQSWRFGTAVADVGNQFLGLLGSKWTLTGNPALPTTIGQVDDPDAVLVRTNAGAVAAVFDAFDAGRAVALVGGGSAIEDIAKAALALQNGQPTKHPELANFANWSEVREYVESDEHAQALRSFVRLIDRRGAQALLNMVDQLTDEGATHPNGEPAYDVIVSTVHKAKGLEWANVRIGDDFPAPDTDPDTGKVRLPAAEELRLAYVAVTRARGRLELNSLGWITSLDPADVEPSDQHEHHRPPQTLTALAQAVPADAEPLPAWLTPARHAQLVKTIHDYAPRYTAANTNGAINSPARYVAEVHVPGGASRDEWNWIADYIRRHPEVADGKPLTDDELKARDRAESGVRSQRAIEAFNAGDTDTVLAIIDQAEPLYGHVEPWADFRTSVIAKDGVFQPQQPAPGDVPQQRDQPPVQAAATPPESPFTAVEQALIRNAVSDYAGGYYGGVLGFGADETARYTSEGHLHGLVREHGLGPVWEAVATVIAADPTVLERGPDERDQFRAEREARADRLALDALAAVKVGEYDLAGRLVDQAELIDPLYRPGRGEHRPYGVTWKEVRELFNHRREQQRLNSGQIVEPWPPGTPSDRHEAERAATVAALAFPSRHTSTPATAPATGVHRPNATDTERGDAR
ncbi:UvrD-helicase domain-containing protein [Polymorphospora sp. NPDC050346]|uniref:UvrD-helicase domain-containing protein n=1 Tax=Polymorphospora sp. NPDC050346 TaxID=3155780 RepID=UPI00340FF034